MEFFGVFTFSFIVLFGITNAINEVELRVISSENDYHVHVDSFDVLQTITTLIKERTCQISIDCNKCDFSKGLIWRPDNSSCHIYYVCDPQPDNTYRITMMTCHHLFWDQELHTCVKYLPKKYSCNPLITPVVTPSIVTSIDPITTPSNCPFEINPNNKREFRPKLTKGKYQSCKPDFMFTLKVCTCLPTKSLPVCNSDMLLRIPFDKHLNDVTCTKALSEIGHGLVTLVVDHSVNVGRVARFKNSYIEIQYLRNHFDQNWVNEFSITAFIKASHTTGTIEEVILANFDCVEQGNIRITYLPSSGQLTALVKTTSGVYTTEAKISTKSSWHHIAWVLGKNRLRLYVDGIKISKTKTKGNMANNDVSMKIGACCNHHGMFNGFIDEVRFYSRKLSSREVRKVSKQRNYIP